MQDEGDVVEGNYIGTDFTGTLALGNDGWCRHLFDPWDTSGLQHGRRDGSRGPEHHLRKRRRRRGDLQYGHHGQRRPGQRYRHRRQRHQRPWETAPTASLSPSGRRATRSAATSSQRTASPACPLPTRALPESWSWAMRSAPTPAASSRWEILRPESSSLPALGQHHRR